MDEIRGIVDGTNNSVGHVNGSGETNGVHHQHDTNSTPERRIDILDIISLNARSEIALGQWDDGCTSLAWNIGDLGEPEVVAGNDSEAVCGRQKRVLAQNWDWRTAVGPNLVMATIKQEGKPDIWMVMEVCQADYILQQSALTRNV